MSRKNRRKKAEPINNLVAKHAQRFCRHKVFRDRTKYTRKMKHKAAVAIR